jgi:hypothetical protein
MLLERLDAGALSELPARGRHGQPDRADRSGAPDELKRSLARSEIGCRRNASEEIQRQLPATDLRRNPCPGFHPPCRSCSTGRVPVTKPASSMSMGPVPNSPEPLPPAAPSPKGPELVFHDPLPTSEPEQQAGRSRVPVLSFHCDPVPKHRKNKRPATRADRLEAVSRELKVLARGRGSSAGQRAAPAVLGKLPSASAERTAIALT